MKTSSPTLQTVQESDRSDRLAGKREEFILPENTIYLNGNSLGPLTRSAQRRAHEVVQAQWGEGLIASWNTHNWIDLPFTAAEKIARLIGADADQVVCCDSVSINLVKLLTSSLQLQAPRNVVLTQADNFPTDLYVAQGLESLLGANRCEVVAVEADAIIDALNDDVAVLLLTEINFRSGDRHDIAKLTRLARERGVLVIWDLSHSVGVMPLALDAMDVDFAVGCGYKYLNGGPGAPAFVYANRRHHAALEQPLQGWMGHSEPFRFDPSYAKGPGMAQFMVGTPPILSLSTLDAALEVFEDLQVQDIYDKASALSELFVQLVAQDSHLKEFTLESNTDPMKRGAHLAFSHADAYTICRALNKAGVVVDFRSPNVIRFGFSPLYLSYEDVWDAHEALSRIVHEKVYLQAEYAQMLKVT